MVKEQDMLQPRDKSPQRNGSRMDSFEEKLFDNAGQTIFMFTFRTEARGHDHSGPNMVCDTPPPQDASIHQIWDNIGYTCMLQNKQDYSRNEVKVIVTVTQNWYKALHQPKIHPHTKFGIPTSNNAGDMLQTYIF